MMPAGRAPRTRWTLPAPPGTHRHARRWGRPGRRVEAGERVELVPCPLGQRGRGHHGAASPARRTRGWRRGRAKEGPSQGELPAKAQHRGGPQEAPGGGAGYELSLPRLPLIPHSTCGVSGGAPHSKGQGTVDGGYRVRGWVTPRGGTGGRQSRKGPEAHVGSPGRERACTSLLAEPPGGDWLPNPRIEVPTAVGPPFVRNSIRWQSRY